MNLIQCPIVLLIFDIDSDFFKSELYHGGIMKRLSLELLADTVVDKRKKMKMSQVELSKKTGINRSILSRLESEDYSPSVDQLLVLMDTLGFSMQDVISEDGIEEVEIKRKKIAVAGTGYVGLSLAVLMSQHNDVIAVDIIPEKVEKINNHISPIQDEYIEKFLAEYDERGLSLIATLDGEMA